MNFWEQFAIAQASVALSTVIHIYGAKFFTAEELAATDVLVRALADLPNRINKAPVKPKAAVKHK